MSFFVVDVIDIGVLIVVHILQVLLNNELLPYLHYLLVKVPRLLDLSLLFKQFPHIIVTAAQVNTLRPVL